MRVSLLLAFLLIAAPICEIVQGVSQNVICAARPL